MTRPAFIRGIPVAEYYREWGRKRAARRKGELEARQPDGREFLYRWINSPRYSHFSTKEKRLIAVYCNGRLVGAFESPRERGEFFDGRRIDDKRANMWTSKFSHWRRRGKKNPFTIIVRGVNMKVYCWEGADYPEDD